MAKDKLMVNMGDVVASNEVVAASLSAKEVAVLKAVRDNKMASVVSVRADAAMSVMVVAGVVVALIRKGYVVSNRDKFGVALALSDAGADVAASL
jgi:hypothetical protein